VNANAPWASVVAVFGRIDMFTPIDATPLVVIEVGTPLIMTVCVVMVVVLPRPPPGPAVDPAGVPAGIGGGMGTRLTVARRVAVGKLSRPPVVKARRTLDALDADLGGSVTRDSFDDLYNRPRMRIVMLLRVSLKALRLNMMRTALTMLGVIIGVSAVICTIAI